MLSLKSDMKKILFSFIIVIYCMLTFSASSYSLLKNSKQASTIDWSESGELPEGGEEQGQEDNRELQDDETYRVAVTFNLSNLSINQDCLQASFLCFASSHFPEIDSPPPQGA